MTGSRTAIIGVGVAIALSGTMLASKYIAPLSSDAAANTPANTTRVAQAPAPPTHRTTRTAEDGRGDRLVAARGDRNVFHTASLDSRSVAMLPSGITGVADGKSDRILLAPSPLSTSAFDERFQPSRMADRNTGQFRHFASAAPAQKAVRLASVDPSQLPSGPSATATLPAHASDEQTAEVSTPSQAVSAIDRLANAVPLPSARPAEPEAAQSVAMASAADTASSPADAARAIAENLPDTVPLPDVRPTRAPEKPAQTHSNVLAYARPEAPEDNGNGLLGQIFGKHARLPGPGSGIAVYDIKTATVYLPNGEKLEAHSGLGHMRDNPRYVNQKNRGPTPPNVYRLVMRERRFHGVEAVRLLPIDGKKKYGRDGLLAHTYMYRGGGGVSQSNGCVVFKDYRRFLTAFKRGHINRMIVVPDMSKLPTYMASL